jgi:peptide-methionine (S)-S-oxide reductase
MPLSPTTIREYDDAAPPRAATETATFALGCFWGPDAQFGAIEGVVRTRVGYAGGTASDPTYHDLGDHTESVQVEYVPDEVSFTDLLEVAFRSHTPTRQSRKTQYQNIVFIDSPAQQDALDSYLDEAGHDRTAIETRIEPLEAFVCAEPYHQKHKVRSSPALLEPIEEAGYDDTTLRESPAVAKLNAYAAGHDCSATADLGLETGHSTAGPSF